MRCTQFIFRARFESSAVVIRAGSCLAISFLYSLFLTVLFRFSYFYEAFEGLLSLNPPDKPEALKCMKYMLLCKIMTNNASVGPSFLSLVFLSALFSVIYLVFFFSVYVCGLCVS